MNIAVCVSGQYRSEWINANILSAIVNHANIDVFMHQWSDTVQHNLIEHFQPKEFVFEPQRDFSSEGDSLSQILSAATMPTPWCGIGAYPSYKAYSSSEWWFNTCSQYYSVAAANQLRKNYEIKNNVHYDFVVRLRLDAYVVNPIDVLLLDIDTLYTVYDRKFNMDLNRYWGINDAFAIGSGKNMDTYCSIYTNLKNTTSNITTNQQCNRFSNESLLLQNLLDHNTKLGFIKNNKVGLMRDVKNESVAVYNYENGTDDVVKLKFKKLL
jgi:hypothetical protein